LSSFGAFSQVIINIQEVTHYCFTEPETKILVTKATEGGICEDQLIVLTGENNELRGKASDLEERLMFRGQIIEEQDIIQDLTEHQVDISEQERKRLERKAKSLSVWRKGKEYIIGGVSLIIGGAAGYGIGSAK
jgi:hypothetical protein